MKIRSQFNFNQPFKVIESGINGYYAMMFANDPRQMQFYKKDLSMTGVSATWMATPQKNKGVSITDIKALEAIRYDLITNRSL